MWRTTKIGVLNKGLTMEQLTRRMNGQLKAHGKALSNRFTTISYRWGWARIVAEAKDIYAAKRLLNHISIGSTQIYLEKTKQKFLTTGYNYKASQNVGVLNFDKISRKEFNDQIDKICQDDENSLE